MPGHMLNVCRICKDGVLAGIPSFISHSCRLLTLHSCHEKKGASYASYCFLFAGHAGTIPQGMTIGCLAVFGHRQRMQLRDMRLHGIILVSWALYQSLEMLHMPSILHDNFAPGNHVYEAVHMMAQRSHGIGQIGGTTIESLLQPTLSTGWIVLNHTLPKLSKRLDMDNKAHQ